MLKTIFEAKWYRGQMMELPRAERLAGSLGDISADADLDAVRKFVYDAAEKLGYSDKLYKHQVEAIEAWARGSDVHMATPAGTGRRTSLLLAAFASLLVKGAPALILVPDSISGEHLWLKIRQLRSSLLLTSIVQFAECNDVESLEEAFAQRCGLIICRTSTLFELLQGKDNLGTASRWLTVCGYFGFHGMTLYSLGELAHVRMLIRILRSLSGIRSFFLTSLPMNSPERFADSMLGVRKGTTHATIIGQDTSPGASYEAALWFPALRSKPTQIPSQYEVTRNRYVDEAITIAANLWTNKSVSKGAVWFTLPGEQDVIVRRIKDGISKLLQAGGTQGAEVAVTAHYFDSVEACPPELLRQLELLIVLGLPENIANIRKQAASLLKDDGCLLIIVPDEPVSFCQLREMEALRFLPSSKAFLLPSSAFLERLYLSIFLNLNLGKEIDNSQVSLLTSIADNALWSQAAANNCIVMAGNQRWIVRCAVPSIDSSWGQTQDDVYEYKIEGSDEKLRIDSYRVPHDLHDGGIYRHAGTVFRVSTAEMSLSVAIGDHQLTTIPRLKHCISGLREIRAKSVSLPQGSQEIRYVECTDSPSEIGYTAVWDYSAADVREVMHARAIDYPERRVRAILLKTDCAAEMSVLFWQYLQLHYANAGAWACVFATSDEVVVMARSSDLAQLVEDVYDRYDQISGHFAHFAYSLLDSCPCFNGCERCLAPTMRPYRGVLNKGLVMRSIAMSLARPHFEEDLLYKVEGLPEEGAQLRFEREAGRTIEALRNRFGMFIKVMVPILAADDLGGNIAGLYDGATVRILARRPESECIKTIAHEYAHNWEFDPGGTNISPEVTGDGIPHNGKLIVEGFAQWVAFKICDHWSLVDEAKVIKLWVDDEYGEGFDFLNWLEERVAGFQGVLDLMTKGSVHISGKGEVKLKQLYSLFKATLDIPSGR